MTAHSARRPHPAVRGQRVVLGTSGRRRSAIGGAFNEGHILAMTLAMRLHQVGAPG